MKTSLTEHERELVPLTLDQAAFLQRTFASELEVVPALGEVGYHVRPGSYVGTIIGPDLELRIRAKCGTRNLLYLLGYAYRLARILRDLVDREEVDDVREFLLEILARQLEDLLRLGMRRDYLEREERLVALRGRILLEQLARRPVPKDLALPSRYEDYTEDIPANQVLRYSLERIAPAREPRLRARLSRCEHLLGCVSRRPFRTREIDEFVYDRLTARYEAPHQLCRLLLEGSGLEAEEGSRPFSTFLVDMNKVFERFVATWLREHLPSEVGVRSQFSSSLDIEGELAIRPDLVFFRKGKLVLVADTKYKLAEASRPSNADAYQAVAYCRALGVSSGLLIQVAEHDAPRSFHVRDGSTRIHCVGVGLRGSTDEIEGSMRRVAESIAWHAAQEYGDAA